MAKKKHGGARKGAGRPIANREGRTVTIAASVPESLAASLDELATVRGWNRSKAVTEALRKFLSQKKSRS